MLPFVSLNKNHCNFVEGIESNWKFHSPIVDASGSGGQYRFVWFDASLATSSILLVIVTREGTFERCTRMDHVNGFFYGNIAPMRHFNDPFQACDRQKWWMIFEMNDNWLARKSCNVRQIDNLKFKNRLSLAWLHFYIVTYGQYSRTDRR